MAMYIVPIFNYNKLDHHNPSGLSLSTWGQPGRKPTNPFTFYASIHGMIFTPRMMGEQTDGFKTEKEAEEAWQRCVTSFKLMLGDTGVWGIYRNKDEVEFRGPMVLDTIYRDPKKAAQYLFKQKGFRSEPEIINVGLGVSNPGSLFYHISYIDGLWDVKFIPYSG